MSEWTVQLTARAVRSLEKLPPRIVPAIIEFVYGPLCAHPAQLGKRLSGELDGMLAARRGEFRLIYSLDEEAHVVIVHRIAHRSDAYRGW